MKSQRSFHKTDPTRTLNGLQFIKPWKIKITRASTRLHARLQASEIVASSFRHVQICSKFQKTDNTRRSTRPRSTKPKNCRPKQWATRHHAPPEGLEISAPTNTHSYALPFSFTRSHALEVSHAPTRAMTSWMTSPPTMVWSICPGPPGLTRSSWPGPNHLKKKRKRKSFDQVKLWLWPKVQNFQKWPVPLNFLSTFRFWDPFLHVKLGNCANCPIPKKLTFAQILTKKLKFSRSTCLAQFFA